MRNNAVIGPVVSVIVLAGFSAEPSGVSANESNVGVAESTFSQDDWRVLFSRASPVRFQVLKGNRCLHVDGLRANTALETHDCNSDQNSQRFAVVGYSSLHDNSGWVRVGSPSSGLCLTSYARGKATFMGKCDWNDQRQAFRGEGAPGEAVGGRYSYVKQTNGLCLDWAVRDDLNGFSGNVITWDCNSGYNQRWRSHSW